MVDVRPCSDPKCRFIAVDPIDETTRAFYDKFAFKQIQGDAGGRMYLRIDDALAALEDPD